MKKKKLRSKKINKSENNTLLSFNLLKNLIQKTQNGFHKSLAFYILDF